MRAPVRRSPADLSRSRERTYAALVGAVATAQGRRVGAAHAERAAARFRSWYVASVPHVRAGVDALLDELESQPGGFARRERAGQVKLLRGGLARNAVAQAVVLASPPLSLDDDSIRPSATPV